jgi:hypothetical protein
MNVKAILHTVLTVVVALAIIHYAAPPMIKSHLGVS